MSDDRVHVRVRGRDFLAWKRVHIKRSVLAVAGGLELVVGDVRPWPFKSGPAVEVEWQGIRLLTGWIETGDIDISQGNVERKVEGRDVTGDLVDCSPDPDGPSEWHDSRIDAIATDLCRYFKIPVQLVGEAGAPFPKFSVDPGERAWPAIEKMLRLRGLLAFSPGDGSLRITAPATARAVVDLEEGINIQTVSVHDSTAGRYSLYVVKGQRQGSDDDFGLPITQPEGRAVDESLGRPRPTVIIAEGDVSDEVAMLRAQWQATVAASKAQTITVTVKDWAQFREHDGTPGPLWVPNLLVRAKVPRASIDSDWLISEVDYVAADGDDGGKRATLTMVRPDAFAPVPAILAEDDPFEGLFQEALDAEDAPPDPAGGGT